MGKYYKIVTTNSFFTHLNKGINPLDIPYGAIFTAPKTTPYTTYCTDCLIKDALFHFAEGVFDTMLWHTMLTNRGYDYEIYEIQPLSDVIKQRCDDGFGFYQCGANKIKFLDKQDINKMYDIAVKEYNENQNKYENFKISVDDWKKHQPIVFALEKFYYQYR